MFQSKNPEMLWVGTVIVCNKEYHKGPVIYTKMMKGKGLSWYVKVQKPSQEFLPKGPFVMEIHKQGRWADANVTKAVGKEMSHFDDIAVI